MTISICIKNYIKTKMSERVDKKQNDKQILINEGIGFEWNVTPNYFNKNNCESDDSDRVRRNISLINVILYL